MHAGLRLGRLPAQHHPGVPRFARYADSLPAPAGPTAVDWSRDIASGSWGMCKNDVLGDCTAASVAHALALWESYKTPLLFMTDDEIVRLYSETSGYVKGDPETDRGATCQDVLLHWAETGIELAGSRDRLEAFFSLDPRNHSHIYQALWLFGGLYAGVTLRVAQQSQDIWDLDGDLTPWGGHCVLIVAADTEGMTCVTWGDLKRVTWRWWDSAAEEVFGLLSTRWVASGRSPAGIAVSALQADMDQLRSS